MGKVLHDHALQILRAEANYVSKIKD